MVVIPIPAELFLHYCCSKENKIFYGYNRLFALYFLKNMLNLKQIEFHKSLILESLKRLEIITLEAKATNVA